MRGKASKLIYDEKGQILYLLMAVMLFCVVLIPPTLSYMSSGLKAVKEVYEEKMYLSYAADSGVENGLWQVKTKNLPNLFAGYDPEYDQYAYYSGSSPNNSYQWSYYLDEKYGADGIVNNSEVKVTFQNVWMPKDIPVPSLSEAKSIAFGRLVVYGSMSGSSGTEYQIKLIYYYNDQEPTKPDYDPNGENLRVQKIGIWLPPGFSYNGGLSGAPGTPDPENVAYKGGRAVVWSFAGAPRLKDFPLGTSSDNPIVRYITFQFTGPVGRTPGTALSWVDSEGVSGIPYSWDTAVKVYQITSEAENGSGETLIVDAYAATTEVLKRGAAIYGDYCAIGGTLLTTTTDVYYRDRLFKETSATVQSSNEQAPFYIPPNAQVELALLYWSGWLENAGIWGDDCASFANWTHDDDWGIHDSGSTPPRFRGHGDGQGTAYLTMNGNVDLSYYVGQTVRLSFSLAKGGTLESSDGLNLALSADGGNSWNEVQVFRGNSPPSSFTYTIPSQYLTPQFRIRFILVGCTEGSGGSREYVYIDNILISLATGTPVENFRVNKIRFNGVNITADPLNIQTDVASTGGATSLSYSCCCDITALVYNMIGSGMLGSNGSGTYTVGHVLDWPGQYQMYNTDGTPAGTTAFPLGTPAHKDGEGNWVQNTQLAYAAWSLVIIYSSPQTLGHQLYLYDYFGHASSGENLDFDGDGQPGGTIGGFIAPESIRDEAHAARLTCFVGEGDDVYDGDYIRVNTVKLWDGITTGGNSQTSPNDVWNEKSMGLAQSGIDIDTFAVTYPIIKPGDIQAKVDMYTPLDHFNLVYIILSFRSDIVPASTVSYLLR